MFVIISDTDDTFNFIVAIMYTQLFNLLCDKADDVYGGRLPYHVRLLLDEFSNIGQIPKFDKLIATIRSREISASIILQSQSQLKTIYKDAAETILGNCDSMLFLGGKESSTLKEISETLGKETIDLYNTSDTRGQSPSYAFKFRHEDYECPDHSYSVRTYDRDLPIYFNRTDPICNHDQSGVGADRDQLFQRAFCPGVPGIPDDGMRGHLFRTGGGHPVFG